MRDLQRTQRRHIMASRQHVGYSLGMQGRTVRASALMGIFRECPIVTSYILRTHEPCTAVPKIFANHLVFTKISTTYKEKCLRRILEWSFVQISYKLSFCHNMPQIPYVFTQLSLFIRDGIKRLIFLWDSSARAVRPYRSSEFPAWFTTTYYFVPLRKLVY